MIHKKSHFLYIFHKIIPVFCQCHPHFLCTFFHEIVPVFYQLHRLEHGSNAAAETLKNNNNNIYNNKKLHT